MGEARSPELMGEARVPPEPKLLVRDPPRKIQGGLEVTPLV